MGLGPPVLALYRQLKGLGVFDGITDVMELGAQNVWCPQSELVKALFKAFGKPEPSAAMLNRFANWKGSGLELYTALGFNYRCVDLDPQFNSIPLDLNFDPCPPEHVGKYGFVTNHGTSEHILNQYNVFKVMHDFTKPGGYMLHAVPSRFTSSTVISITNRTFSKVWRSITPMMFSESGWGRIGNWRVSFRGSRPCSIISFSMPRRRICSLRSCRSNTTSRSASRSRASTSR